VGIQPRFLDLFRRTDEMKYRLMPYIYAQAKYSTEHGLPMVRALFVEYRTIPAPGRWTMSTCSAPTFWWPRYRGDSTGRDVYLPAGEWIDYQTGKLYSAAGIRSRREASPS